MEGNPHSCTSPHAKPTLEGGWAFGKEGEKEEGEGVGRQEGGGVGSGEGGRGRVGSGEGGRGRWGVEKEEGEREVGRRNGELSL